MKKTFNLTNAEIIVKLAQRKALLEQANAKEQADRESQLDGFVTDYLNQNGLSATALEPTVKETIRDQLSQGVSNGY